MRSKPRTIIVLLYLLSSLNPVIWAANTIDTIDWSHYAEAGRLDPSFVLTETDRGLPAITIEHPGAEPRLIEIAIFDRPRINSSTWAIRGTVRYTDVHDGTYLEVWSVLTDGSRFFSRALANDGPMSSLSGSSDWRPFVLPFFADETTPPLEQLIVDIQFTGRGTVELGPLEVVEYSDGEDPLKELGSRPWWSDRQAGIFGGISGGFIGVLGALVGILTALGRHRRIINGILRFMAFGGLVALAAGLTALVLGQPYGVWYPPSLLGALMAILGIVLGPIVAKSFGMREERRMRALDQ